MGGGGGGGKGTEEGGSASEIVPIGIAGLSDVGVSVAFDRDPVALVPSHKSANVAIGGESDSPAVEAIDAIALIVASTASSTVANC